MKRIVVSCASGLKNSGDEALLEALLRSLGPEVDVFAISFDPEYTSAYHGISSCAHGDISKKRKWIASCDLFIMGGGGLLQDETSIFNVWLWISEIRLALSSGKRVLLYANSIGPLNYAVNRYLVKQTLPRVTAMTLRDEISLDLLTGMGIKKKAYLTMDPVFSSDSPSHELVLKTNRKYCLPQKYHFFSVRHWYDTHPLIPVSVCSRLNLRTPANWHRYHRLTEELASVVRWINLTLGCPVVFGSFCTERDSKVAKDILKILGGPNENRIIDDPFMRPLEMMAIMKGAEMVTGMRLHAAIYSMIVHQPFIAMVYSDKCRGLLSITDMECYGISVDAFNSKGWKKRYEIIREEFDSIREKLSSISFHAREREKRNSDFLQNILHDG